MNKKKLEPSIENVLTKKEKTVKKVLKSAKEQTLSSDNTVKGIAPACIYPGMYVYDDNFISKEFIADRQVKAVVAYLDYHQKTVYAICPEINKLPWSSDCLDVNTRYADGKRITQEIVKEAERTKKKLKLPSGVIVMQKMALKLEKPLYHLQTSFDSCSTPRRMKWRILSEP